MAKFDWAQHDLYVEALRSMGCAVVTITPEDIQTLTADEDDAPTISDEAVRAWMTLRSDDVEEAILGDYWGDTIRDLIAARPIEESTPCAAS
jgi:hypothetical protein